MIKKWNFLLEGKLIDAYAETFEAAQKKALLILEELKQLEQEEV